MAVLGSVLKNLFGKRYTIGELMSIDAGRQDKAAKCTVTLSNIFYSVKQETVLTKFRSLFADNNVKVFYITLKLKVKSDTGNTHNVFIHLEPDFSMHDWKNNRVKIYCDCADFKYRSAYILDKRDSLFANDWIKMALGQAMTDIPTGKRGVTTLCKHAYAAVTWLATNYEKVMMEL